MNPQSDRALGRSVLTLALARVFVNMTRRFAFPFLPEISRELGTSLVSVQSAQASQAGVGLFSPLFGHLSERYGRKRVMLAAQGVMALVCLPGLAAPRSFGVFYLLMVVWGFAKWIFDPAMQAYVADRVAYHRRGLAIGVTELAWAGSLALAAPLTGYLLGLSGLRLVYLAIMGFNLVGLVLVWWHVPADFLVEDRPTRQVGFRSSWAILFKSRAALVALGYGLLLFTANEMVYIIYGDWLEQTFGLVLAALGTVTIVIAAAEVLGEFLVIGIADRIGKRRLALVGTLVSSLCYALLPHLTSSLALFLVGLFITFLAVETAIVASIPLFTEVLPEARAVMMSSVAAAQSGGRFVGAFVGGLVYSVANFEVAGVLALGIGLGGLVCLWALREG